MSAATELRAKLTEWIGVDIERGVGLQTLDEIIARRAEVLGFPSPETYVRALRGSDDPEAVNLIETITVGCTWFFRDPEQFEIIGGFLRGWPTARRVANVWIAGCSTGEEAYTMSIVASRVGRPVRVFATDVNESSLEHARAGDFGRFSFRHLPPGYDDCFEIESSGARHIRPWIREPVEFRPHNLLDPPPAPPEGTGWDVILCRNVLIYFRPDLAMRVLRGLARSLAHGGLIFLAAGEVVCRVPPELELAKIGARYALQRSGAGAERAAWVTPPSPPPAAPVPLEPIAVPPEEVQRSNGLSAQAEGSEAVVVAPLAEREAERRPEGRPAAYMEAYRAVRHGEPEEAVSVSERLVDEDPLDPAARLLLGIAYSLGGDLEAASSALRAALFLEPGLWPAWYYLAITRENLGREEGAKRAYRRVLETCDNPVGCEAPFFEEMLAWKDEVVRLAQARATRRARTRPGFRR